MMKLKYIFLISLIFIINFKVSSETLVSDFSDDTVEISARFNGTELLLFGAVEWKKNDDLIISVTGPRKNITVYEKSKISNIWLNTDSILFKNIPSYYYVAINSSANGNDKLNVLKSVNLGYQNLEFLAENPFNKNITYFKNTRLNQEKWENALINKMEKSNRWKFLDNNNVKIIKNKLFRLPLDLPDNIMPGIYNVQIIHLRNQKVIAKEISSISVLKTGLEAQIYSFAHNYSMFYGIFAIVFAIFSGYLAAVAFRKV